MEKINLMVLSDHYLAFVKDQVEFLSKFCNQIHVFVRKNPIAEISSLLPIEYLKPFRKKALIDLTKKPKNVTIHFSDVIFLPIDKQYKKLGERYFKAVDNTIIKNRIEFDLVHSHFIWPNGYIGAKIKEKYSVPFIITAHGYDVYDLPFRDSDWTKKIQMVLNIADNIITVSNSNIRCIKKLNVKTPVRLITNGFRNDLFYPKEKIECKKALRLPSDNKIILSVGRLMEVKGHRYLIEAMRKIVNQRDDVLCIIIGDGKLKRTLEKYVLKTGLKKHVFLVGRKPHREISKWINASDLFVLPSLNEGSPTVMFEVLGCGQPFLGTKVGGIPEIINSDEYGFLIEPANSDDLAEKILIGLDKKWDNKKLIRYAGQFTWNNIVQQLIEVYEKVLIKHRIYNQI